MAQPETQFIKPETILKQIGLQPGMQVADLGCGAGYFSLPAARLAGSRGKVYAIDVQKSVLAQLRKEAQTQGVAGLEMVWSDIEVPGATKIPAHTLDMAFLINTLFQAQNKRGVIGEAKRLLKPDGLLLLIDWQPGDAAMGPKIDKRLDLVSIRQIMKESGFVEERPIAAGSHHFGLLFKAM